MGWRGAALTPRLLVLDFERDKANVKGRFFEAYPLTELLLDRPEVIEMMRALLADTEGVERRLMKALISAHDDQRRGGFALRDAEATFWRSTEPHFLSWLSAVAALEDWDEASERRSHELEREMNVVVRRVALELYDAQVAMSELDLGKAPRIARARRALRADLYPSPRPASSRGESETHAAT